MKPFVKRVWKDLPSTDTPINAVSLNKVEDCLVDVTAQIVQNVDALTSGSGMLVGVGALRQLSMTFTTLETLDPFVIFEFPVGHKPVVDFQCSIQLATGNHDTIGDAYYIALENKLYVRSSANSVNACRISCTYITFDE